MGIDQMTSPLPSPIPGPGLNKMPPGSTGCGHINEADSECCDFRRKDGSELDKYLGMFARTDPSFWSPSLLSF